MYPNLDNFNRPEALLNARRSERRYAEQGVLQSLLKENLIFKF